MQGKKTRDTSSKKISKKRESKMLEIKIFIVTENQQQPNLLVPSKIG
jgi:hypothetical protein